MVDLQTTPIRTAARSVFIYPCAIFANTSAAKMRNHSMPFLPTPIPMITRMSRSIAFSIYTLPRKFIKTHLVLPKGEPGRVRARPRSYPRGSIGEYFIKCAEDYTTAVGTFTRVEIHRRCTRTSEPGVSTNLEKVRAVAGPRCPYPGLGKFLLLQIELEQSCRVSGFRNAERHSHHNTERNRVREINRRQTRHQTWSCRSVRSVNQNLAR